MGWQDILKSEEEEQNKLLEELVNNVHFFWKGASKDNIVRYFEPLSYNVDRLKPLIRSLEFMRPIKDDLEFVERGTRIYFSYYFEIFGKRCGVQFRHHELGEIAEDVFITVGNTEVCVKANSIMTKGDFLTTLVLAVKNNTIPNIIKFVAYAMSTDFSESESDPDKNTIFNYHEDEYKIAYITHLIKSGKLMGERREIYNFIHQGLWALDSFLLEKGVPKEVLGRW